MTKFKEIADSHVEELDNDFSSLWFITIYVECEFATKSDVEARPLTIRVIRELLSDSRTRVGDYYRNES